MHDAFFKEVIGDPARAGRFLRERRRIGRPVLPLPPVIPLVVHHGPRGWTASAGFAELSGSVPEPLFPYLPSFRHALVDLAGIADRDLSSDPDLRMRLKALKCALHPDLGRLLDVILAESAMLEDMGVVAVLAYIVQVPAGIGEEAIREALQRAIPSRVEDMMTACMQRYVDQGIAKGLQQGKAEGKAGVLLRLMQRRFGPLPPGVEARVRSADGDRLDAWIDRVLDVGTAEDLFGDGSPH